TLRVPLPLLNAIPAARCEWLVPGLLQDKVAALIRSLPKAQRRNFVPAPEFARAFMEAEATRDAPLNNVLAAFLKRITGIDVDAAAFDANVLPPHLQMRFHVPAKRSRSMRPQPSRAKTCATGNSTRSRKPRGHAMA